MHVLNGFLRLELVKEHFKFDPVDLSGNTLESFLSREDVKHWVDELESRLAINSDLKRNALPPSCQSTSGLSISRQTSAFRLQSFSQEAGDSVHVVSPQLLDSAACICEDETPDPENDVLMINKLLEMLKKDEDFDKVKFHPFFCPILTWCLESEKEQDADIGHVDTEILQKEEILEQLKRSIKQYQVLLDENDALVRELNSLEVTTSTLLIVC